MKKVFLIVVIILLVFVSYSIGKKSQMSTNMPVESSDVLETNLQQEVSSSHQYIYENWGVPRSAPDYFQVIVNYQENDVHTTVEGSETRIQLVEGVGKGRYKAGIVVEDINAASDFCSNTNTLSKRELMFQAIDTGIGTALCFSNSSDLFKIPADYDFALLNNFKKMDGATDGYKLPMVIGKYYVEIYAHGGFSEATAKIKMLAQSFSFSPSYQQ